GAFAQNPVRCASQEYKQQQIALNPALQQVIDAEDQNADQFAAAHPNGYQARATITIPVIFHVVYKTAGQNISDTRLIAQMDVLNKDYRRLNSDTNLIPAVWKTLAADCDINFCFAHRDPNGNWTNGIERTVTTVTSWSTNDAVKSAASGGADAWDRSKYLNIWVCNLSGGVLGYASFPGGPAADDGVVLSYQYVGTTGSSAPYNKGRTATHEVGHWLNMRHIWGDDGSSCSGSDACADTPNQADENYGCPAFPHTDACSAASPGVMFMNYMDYTDDACMYMFTTAQKTRMWATLNGSRVSLQTSNGCLPTGIQTSTLTGIFSIAPSPTSGAFTVSFGNAAPQHFDLFIYNILGEQVFNNHYDALNEGELHLDLQGNPAGIYLVEVRTATTRTTKKIVLQ
ncbi:MAG: M43 family zinc metalloprotease, partial [Bacteroidota bacterium]|nr:M43 family zinc metalloprotease [Bacteroidota bacterium]